MLRMQPAFNAQGAVPGMDTEFIDNCASFRG